MPEAEICCKERRRDKGYQKGIIYESAEPRSLFAAGFVDVLDFHVSSCGLHDLLETRIQSRVFGQLRLARLVGRAHDLHGSLLSSFHRFKRELSIILAKTTAASFSKQRSKSVLN